MAQYGPAEGVAKMPKVLRRVKPGLKDHKINNQFQAGVPSEPSVVTLLTLRVCTGSVRKPNPPLVVAVKEAT